MLNKGNFKKILILSTVLFLVSNVTFAQEITGDSTTSQGVGYTLNLLSPVDLILITLSGLTTLFTLLIIILSILVYCGIKNAKDFGRKQKELLIKQKVIIEKGEKEIGESNFQAKKIIEELKTQKDQIKTTADFEKYRKQTEGLINSLEKSIKNTEDRMRDLRISSSASSISSTGMGFSISSTENKLCSSCGMVYVDPSLGPYSQCPNCGNLNY